MIINLHALNKIVPDFDLFELIMTGTDGIQVAVHYVNKILKCEDCVISTTQYVKWSGL